MTEIKLEKKKYDLFLCSDCKNIIAYEQYTGEGHKCPVCNSKIFFLIGTYKEDRDA